MQSAPKRWREELKRTGAPGAFHRWKVVLLVRADKRSDSLIRWDLIKAKAVNVKTSLFFLNYCCSVAQLRLTLQPHGLQQARLPCPGVCSSNSSALSQWCHPTISASVVPFSCPQSFPVSWLFTSGGQSIGASESVLLMNIQDWFPIGLTGLISLQSKELLRVFSNTTVRKHHCFGTQPSLWFTSQIHMWLLEKNSFDKIDICQQSDVSAF